MVPFQFIVCNAEKSATEQLVTPSQLSPVTDSEPELTPPAADSDYECAWDFAQLLRICPPEYNQPLLTKQAESMETVKPPPPRIVLPRNTPDQIPPPLPPRSHALIARAVPHIDTTVPLHNQRYASTESIV